MAPASPLDSVPPAVVQALAARWPVLLAEARDAGHDVEADPYLTLDPEGLLLRFLVATDHNVVEAERRIRAMLEWRREWRILDCHQPGMAEHLYSEASNPGSEMYFSQSCHEDRDGRPYVVGRVYVANGSNMHPWRHLRAGVFVIERMAVEVLRRRCHYGSYILDIGHVEKQGTVSGTGFTAGNFKESDNPYYKRGAGREAPQWMLDKFGVLNSGMGVLRAAIAIGNNHYPELMQRVIFLRSNWLFAAAFKIFSLWVHKRSRDKFMFVEGGFWGALPVESLKQWYSDEELPEEFGGTGWRLDNDRFLRTAIDAYDADPALPRQAPALPRYAGWTEERRRCAAADAAVYRRRYPDLAKGGDLASAVLVRRSSLRSASGRDGSDRGSDEEDAHSQLCCMPCFARPRPPRERTLNVSFNEAKATLTLPLAGRRQRPTELYRMPTKSVGDSVLEVIVYALWGVGIAASLYFMGIVALDVTASEAQ